MKKKAFFCIAFDCSDQIKRQTYFYMLVTSILYNYYNQSPGQIRKMEKPSEKLSIGETKEFDISKLVKNICQCKCNFVVKKEIENISSPTSSKFDQYLFQIRKNFMIQLSSDQINFVGARRLDYSAKIKYDEQSLLPQNQMASQNQRGPCSFMLSFLTIGEGSALQTHPQQKKCHFQLVSKDPRAHDFLRILLSKPILIEIDNLRSIFNPGKKIYDSRNLKVLEATNRRTGSKFAVKCYPKEVFHNFNSFSSIRAQMLLLYYFRHENIISINEAYCTTNSLYIIQQILESNLEYFILHKSKVFISLEFTKDLMRQLLRGLQYLHENNIVHKGLNLKKIYVKNPLDPQIRLVISGFSKSEINGIGINQLANPEEDIIALMQSIEKFKEEKEAKAEDMLSLGIIFQTIINKVKEQGNFKTIPEQMQVASAEQLIQSMILEDWNSRCSATEALNHNFLDSPVTN